MVDQGPTQPQVGHHSHHYGVAGQGTALVPVDGTDCQQVIAVEQGTVIGHGKNPVPITVKGQTGIGPGLHHGSP